LGGAGTGLAGRGGAGCCVTGICCCCCFGFWIVVVVVVVVIRVGSGRGAKMAGGVVAAESVL
jgi:hypothetical protein